MNKKLKLAVKLLSVFLAALFVLQVMPVQTMAASFSALIENLAAEEQQTEEASTEKEEAKILYEVEGKRDEYTKVYKRSDGTYTAVISNSPVHFEKDGKWEEIDNTLVESEDSTKDTLTNTSSDLKVELPNTLSDSNEIVLENDGYTLSFSIDDISNSKAKPEKKEVVEDQTDEEKLIDNSKNSSKVTYKKVLPKTDVEYTVTGTTVKENIIINKKSGVKDEYNFTINAGDLIAAQSSDGNVIFSKPMVRKYSISQLHL